MLPVFQIREFLESIMPQKLVRNTKCCIFTYSKYTLNCGELVKEFLLKLPHTLGALFGK